MRVLSAEPLRTPINPQLLRFYFEVLQLTLEIFASEVGSVSCRKSDALGREQHFAQNALGLMC
jgi:hypothetical protein